MKNTHQALAPLLEKFFREIPFGRGHSIFDPALAARLSDSDVREHLRAVFVPLIRRKTLQTQVRAPEAAPVSLRLWWLFQVTISERRPVQISARTLFNLVPCNRTLETAFVALCDKVQDVAAFGKNAGPQCLRIDYLSDGARLAFYTPDFFVRMLELLLSRNERAGGQGLTGQSTGGNRVVQGGFLQTSEMGVSIHTGRRLSAISGHQLCRVGTNVRYISERSGEPTKGSENFRRLQAWRCWRSGHQMPMA